MKWNAYRILVKKPEGKRPRGRPRCRWMDSIKMDLRYIRWCGMDWIDLARDRNVIEFLVREWCTQAANQLCGVTVLMVSFLLLQLDCSVCLHDHLEKSRENRLLVWWMCSVVPVSQAAVCAGCTNMSVSDVMCHWASWSNCNANLCWELRTWSCPCA
jgi:hypothetical protein